ncbi:MAG: Fe-S cluster assembly protein SufB, partial [Bacteroidetes bacterium]|nr:Fe-S cluster assembly protein SufB [Bacteroidota bacterium]
MAQSEQELLEQLSERDYPHGFESNIEQEIIPKGLTEDTIRFISQRKNEPDWLLQWRLKAYKHWLGLKEPDWQKLTYPAIDY